MFQHYTWDQIVADFPDATIVGGFGLNIGRGWSGTFTGYVDALKIGINGQTTTYDFEPDATICKQGGWASVPGFDFKNQGACVSFVASGGNGAYAK